MAAPSQSRTAPETTVSGRPASIGPAGSLATAELPQNLRQNLCRPKPPGRTFLTRSQSHPVFRLQALSRAHADPFTTLQAPGPPIMGKATAAWSI